MIEIFILCAAYIDGGWECVPFQTEDMCYAAEEALSSVLIEESECEMILRYDLIAAPIPEPAPWPKTGQHLRTNRNN